MLSYDHIYFYKFYPTYKYHCRDESTDFWTKEIILTMNQTNILSNHSKLGRVISGKNVLQTENQSKEIFYP